MSEAPFTVPDSYAANLDDPINAAHALRLAVAAFLDDAILPLDSLYINLEPCELVLARHPDLLVALKDGCATGDFSKLRIHTALRRQRDAAEFAERVATILPAITAFIEEGGLDMWVPDPEDGGEDEDHTHIAALAVPSVYGRPSVLLRGLGRFATDDLLAQRVDNIFSKGKHTFLVNTSGSGKTRLTFEGLCQHWGFYMVGAIDANSIGSSDLPDVLGSYIKWNREGFSIVAYSREETAKNLRITQGCLRKLLLGRLVVFSIFAEHIHVIGIKPEHKKLWLLLQALTESLKCGLVDIFSELVGLADAMADDYIKDYNTFLLNKLRRLFGDDFHLFVVIDEAQVISESYSVAYRSADGTYYPILREIVDALNDEFSQHEVSFVISGTRIPSSDFQQSRHVDRHRWCSDTGAFSDEDIHRRYVSTYLPPAYAKTAAGQAFLRRVWEWCRGRHRITDSLMATILRNEFKSPHTLLNEYVRMAIGYCPKIVIDPEFADEEEPASNEFIMISSVDCDLLDSPSNSHLVSAIRDSLFHHCVVAGPPPPLDNNNDLIALVSTGFGRFSDRNRSQIMLDEPLLLIPAANWLYKRPVNKFLGEREDSLLEILQQSLTSSRVYPACLVIYLSRVFAANPRVNEVFTFPGSKPKWANKRAEIVSLGSVEPGYASVDLTSEVLAAAPLSLEDTVSWLTNDTLGLPPFCLGQSHDSPDIIFGLRLEDGTLKRVLVHTSVTTSNLRGDSLRKVINDFSDENLFKDEDPIVHDRAIAALHAIAQTTTGPRKSPVLRVFASFPGTLRLGDVTHAPNLAQLNNAKFSKIIQTIPASLIFEKIVKSFTLQLGKRKRSTEKPSASRKRMKHS
ncbi:hypothetical protein R3P38DRAFT_3543679 [Favolaschia claudopus]|uniref:Helicase ATP-binding domain-containing protein n=1 Tax=Favolaschia claudopus TaxID=2862362 RepID=A0AAW0B5F0_9AGAR